jgi:hypothetical protein
MGQVHRLIRGLVLVLFVAAICAFFGLAAFSQMPPGSFQGPPAPTHHDRFHATGTSHHGITGHGVGRKAAATP